MRARIIMPRNYFFAGLRSRGAIKKRSTRCVALGIVNMSAYGKVEPYTAPEWARDLDIVPKTKIPVNK